MTEDEASEVLRTLPEASGDPAAASIGAWRFIEQFGHGAEHLYYKGKHFVCSGFGVGVLLLLRESPFVESVITGALSGLECAAVVH